MNEAENRPEQPAAPAKQLPLPDVGDLLFVGVMHILLFARPDFMFQDGSVGWHLTAGKWIFENRAIPRTDLFSYTFPEKAWVAYEWLFDLIAYILTLLGGLNLLAVAVATTLAFVLVKVYDRAREQGGPLQLVVPVAIIGIFASAIHWLARPHIVTLLCVFFYLAKLDDYYRGTISSTKLFLYLGLLMLLWVNCHPAFGLGIVLIGLYFLAALVGTLKRTSAFAKVKNLFIAGVVASLATLLNPYGIDLYKYILEYLHGSTVLANTDEFRSPVFHIDDRAFIHALCLELLIAFFFIGLAISKKRPTLPYFSATLLFLHMALSAVRSIPYFAIASVPAIGLLFSSTRLEGKTRPVSTVFPALKPLANKYGRAFSQFAEQEMLCKMRILPILYVCFVTVMSLMGGGVGDTKILSSGFSKIEMPTRTLAYIRDNDLPYDRGFNYDNWGGLIRYQLDRRVFIDDRADFYGEEFYTKYGAIVQTHPGWEKLLDHYKIEWVLMPKSTKLELALRSDKNWVLACDDDASVLFRRRD